MAQLKATARQEQAPDDPHTYYVWHATEGNAEDVPPGKYLVDDRGRICWLVDPGINGRLTHRDDGTEVRKYPQPQARLFALITHGILNQKLPWTLVLLGVLVAAVVELTGVSSLAFAVGMYLPLSSSAPIFVGGLVRYVVERFGRRETRQRESELESEMSPGVLFSTGYIAGGSIAGVLIAFCNFNDKFTAAMASVGEYVPHQSATALVTFLLLAVFLVLVGRGWVLKSRPERSGQTFVPPTRGRWGRRDSISLAAVVVKHRPAGTGPAVAKKGTRSSRPHRPRVGGTSGWPLQNRLQQFPSPPTPRRWNEWLATTERPSCMIRAGVPN